MEAYCAICIKSWPCDGSSHPVQKPFPVTDEYLAFQREDTPENRASVSTCYRGLGYELGFAPAPWENRAVAVLVSSQKE